MERKDELEARVREAPLSERLDECRKRIGKMCSEGRPPRMCIPVQWDDDDFYISTTLADAQRALDGERELCAAWAEKARQYELELDGDPQNLHGQGRTFGLRQQLATLQAQLRQVEGERDQWIAANTKEPINEPVTYQALAGARFVAKRAFDELVKARSELSTLRQLVEMVKPYAASWLQETHGDDYEQRPEWQQVITTLAAQDAGKAVSSG